MCFSGRFRLSRATSPTVMSEGAGGLPYLRRWIWERSRTAPRAALVVVAA